MVTLWGAALCGCVLPTISDYYDLRTRDAFVGILFTIAWFLFTYRGYSREDDRAGNLACVVALCIALFPTNGSSLEHHVYLVFATRMFLVLAYFSYFLFTRTGDLVTPEKRSSGWKRPRSGSLASAGS